MASITEQPCTKCSKGRAVIMCAGCQLYLCGKHFVEHRQELAIQMDNVGHEHDLLRRDLTRENGEHPLLSRINEWERQAITKIQVTAEATRADVYQWIDLTKNQLKT